MNKNRWIVLLSVLVLALVVGQVAVFAADQVSSNVHERHHQGNMSVMNMMGGSGMMEMMGNMDMEQMMEHMNSPEGQEMIENCKKLLNDGQG